MRSLLFVLAAVVAAAMADDSVTVGDVDATTYFMPTTEAPITEYSLHITHKESSTSSIKILWTPSVPDFLEVTKFAIETNKVGSDSVTFSPELAADEDSFEVQDLVKDTVFRVCVVTSLDYTNSTETMEQTTCIESYTIPYIRNDSVYVLFIVILIIVALIVIGVISWKMAVNKALKEAEEEEDESNEGKEAAKQANKPEEAQPILLSSPTDDRPKSSIEDMDIPYITPPWSEIEREQQQKAAASNSVSGTHV